MILTDFEEEINCPYGHVGRKIMRKALIISLFIFISLMVFIGCDGGIAGSSDEKVFAPIPVFLTGPAQDIPVLKAAAEELTEEQCFVMYMQFGVPAFIGFEGETESSEIADVEIFDSSVSLTWEESDGVFTYRTINDGTYMDIAIELSYDSASDSYDYMQAKRCEYDGYYDYYSVSIASDVEYDRATKSWNGDYKAYITMRMPGSEEPYVFNNIASGKFHSEDGLTGVFVYHMDLKSPASGDADDGVDRAFDLDAVLSEHDGLETARLLIDKMDGVSTTNGVDSYQILYSKDGRYEIFTYSDATTAEAREACLEHIEEISGGSWKVDPSSIPEPSAS